MDGKKKERDEFETWETRAVIKDEAKKEGKTEAEKMQQVMTLVGKRKREWKARMKKI